MEETYVAVDRGGLMQSFPSGSDPVDSKILGREKQLDHLVRLLLFGPRADGKASSASNNTPLVSVIALVGMGGVGKTTLAQHAYNHLAVKAHFAPNYWWVSASHDFQVPDLIRKVLEASQTDGMGLNDLGSLQQALRSRVKDRRFLLVVDDIWNERAELWDEFFCCFEHSAKGSRILITTRKNAVARAAAVVETINVGCLSDKDGWSLLQRYTFGNSSDCCPHQLEPIGRKIVTKCKGLPLALKVLGSRLSFQIDEETWRGVLESDLWDIRTYEEGERILRPLLLSYLDLPSHLKHCFKICSMYPKDHSIDKHELIALWMANDLIINAKEKENWSSLVEIGMGYIDSLMSRSFLHSIVNQEIGMHDLIHDLAQFLSGDACTARIGGEEAPDVHETVRHLWVRPDASCPVNLVKRDSALRTLILDTRNSPRRTSLHFKNSAHDVLGCLRMMTLCEDPPNELLGCLDKMKHLRYLKCFTVTKEVLESVQRLHNLRVLEMFTRSSTDVGELPESIGNLKNLLRFQLASTEPLYLKRLPESIGELSSLCEFTLWGVQVNEIPESVGGLTNLQNIHIRRCSIRTLPDSIGKLSSLKEAHLSVCTKLQKIPESIGQLSCLQTLLFHSVSISGLPESTGELSNLLELCLKSCNRLQSLPFTTGGLSKLNKLDLRNCSTIRELPASIGQLSNLQKLIISNCRGLTELPTSIVDMSGLQSLSVDPWISLPSGFGRLNKLEFLKEFSVGKSDEQAGTVELRDLVHLRGSICIVNLNNVVRLEDCTEANMMNKAFIKNLSLKWGSSHRGNETSAWDEKILECLKPHSTLTQLTISSWRGVKLPQWLGDQSFCSLDNIELRECCTCDSLYPLSILPSLKSVYLKGMQALTDIVQETDSLLNIGGDNKKLESGCHFSSLELFYMSDCSSITSVPLYKLPSLRLIEISRCDNLESVDFDGPFLTEQPSYSSKLCSLVNLVIDDCNRLHSLSWHKHLPSLQNLHIAQGNELNLIPLKQTHFPKLFKLSFENCGLRTLSHSISSVKNLEFVGCHSLSSIPLYKLNDLKVLSVYSCDNLQGIYFEGSFFPGQPLAGVNDSLQILYFHDCPRLHFSDSAKLPATLEHLHVINCPLLKIWCISKKNSKEPKVIRVNMIDEETSYFGSRLLINHPTNNETFDIYT